MENTACPTCPRFRVHSESESEPAYGMLFATAALALAFAPFPAAAQPSPVVRTFRVEAGQFAYLPAELNVNPGDTVVIQLVSTDVFTACT